MTNNFEQAKKILADRRADAEAAAEKRRKDLETVSPELKQLNADIASAGLRAMKAIGMGEDAKAYIDALAAENLKAQERRAALLAEMGLPADTLNVHYVCPKCQDTGVLNGHYCDCFRAVVKQLQYDGLNDSAPAKDSTFSNFSLEYYRGVVDEDGTDVYAHMEQVLNYCKNWAADFSRQSPSVLLYGRTGLGKTHLSLAMANAAIQQGYNVVYGPAHNLLNQLNKEQFGRLKGDESPEELLETADLLIIDDLGAEYATPFNVSAIYNVLNTRILMGLPTIISTNLMYDEIGNRYSERVYSRIIGNFTPLEFLGKDVRQLKS